MTKFLIVLSMVCCGTSCGKSGSGGDVAGLPKWTPDESAVAQLADRVTIPDNPDFSIRIPKGFVAETLDTQSGSSIKVTGGRWASPVRNDGSQLRLLVIIGKRSSLENAEPLDRFASNYLASRERSFGRLEKEPIQYGNINGIRFGFVRWSASNGNSGQPTKGFVYVATIDNLDIMIDSQESNPDDKTSLELASAAARTFQKNSPSE